MLSLPGIPQAHLVAVLGEGGAFLGMIGGIAFLLGFRAAALRALAMAGLLLLATEVAIPGNTLLPALAELVRGLEG